MRIKYPNSVTSLGLVASGERSIKSGVEFNHLYPAAHQLKRTDPIIDNGDTYRTLEIMEDYARKYKGDATKITEHLRKGRNINTQRNEILQDLWNHVYNHFQYKEDKPGIEQIRRPARSWHDRQRGIDCDCMSVLFSSMLLNLGIPHAFRKVKYKADWQHVYVVVPKTNTKSLNKRQNYYVLDAVVDSYDYEVPFSKKHDRPMEIQGLNGIGNIATVGYDDDNIKENLGLDLLGIPNSRAKEEFGKEFGFLNGLGNTLNPQQEVTMFLSATKRHLKNTYDIIKSNPQKFEGFTYGYPVQVYLQKLGYLLSNWDNENARYKALNELIIAETEGLNGIFKKIGDAIGNAANAVKEGVVNAAQWTGDKLKKAGQAIVKYNPVSLAARGGLLIAFKSNLFRMAGKLGYGYWSSEKAKSAGLDTNTYIQIKYNLDKVKKMYRGLCGGNVSNGEMDNLKNAIMQGFGKDKANNPEVLRGLGRTMIMADSRAKEYSKPSISTTRYPIDTRIRSLEPTPAPTPVKTPAPTKPEPIPTKASPKLTPLVANASAEQLLEHVLQGGKFKYSFNDKIFSYHQFNYLKRNFKRSPQRQANAYVGSAKKQGGTVQLLDMFNRLSDSNKQAILKDFTPAPSPVKSITKTVKDPIKQPVKSPIKQPVKEPIKQPVKQMPIKQPVKQPVKQPIKTMAPPKPTKEQTLAPPKPTPQPTQNEEIVEAEVMQELAPQNSTASAGSGNTIAWVLGGLAIAGGIYYATSGDDKPKSKANLSGTKSKKKNTPRKKGSTPKRKAKTGSKNIKMTL